MMITFLYILILPFLVFCSTLFSKSVSLYEGDYCNNNNKNGENVGQCISAYECSWALKQIQQRNTVDICYFNRKIPIVCCPLNEMKENQKVSSPKRKFMETATSKSQEQNVFEDINSPPSENLPIKENISSNEFGKLSKSKCDEYYPPSINDVGISAVGGEKTLAEEFPHMAILGYGQENDIQWKCGGSLISLQHILTAAHCLYSRDFGDVKFVRLGDLDIKNETDGTEPQNFIVNKIIQHPDYESKTIRNDIAILELDRPVELTNFVKPACLDIGEEVEEYDQITATGWGITQFDGEPSNHLLKVTLKLVTNEDCRKQYQKNGDQGRIDVSKQICAGSANDEIIMDTCQGDSGGPLQKTVFKNGKHYLVLGITSFGKACGITNSAGIYTRVSHYIPWIESMVFM